MFTRIRNVLGLVLAVSFLLTANAVAQIHRGAAQDGLVEIFTYSLERDAGGAGYTAKITPNYDFLLGSKIIYGSGEELNFSTMRSENTLWTDLIGDPPYTDFAISFDTSGGTGTSTADFLNLLKFNEVSYSGVEEEGYFYGLIDILSGNDRLDLTFDQGLSKYSMTLWGVRDTTPDPGGNVPEPATIALLGLGLGGLGLVSRRRKK